MGIPTHETDRMILRPFSSEDAEPLYHIFRGRDVLKYFPRPTPPPLERVEKLVQFQLDHWEKYGYGWWATTLAKTGELIGWCGLQYITETDETEIGFLLGRPFWGKGFATEAALAGVRFGFEELEIESIIGITHPDNVASQNVLKKIGMSFTNEAEYFGMHCFRYSMNSSTLPDKTRLEQD
jgi:ribosomal-protein-alanine N-acetyltransferase